MIQEIKWHSFKNFSVQYKPKFFLISRIFSIIIYFISNSDSTTKYFSYSAIHRHLKIKNNDNRISKYGKSCILSFLSFSPFFDLM